MLSTADRRLPGGRAEARPTRHARTSAEAAERDRGHAAAPGGRSTSVVRHRLVRDLRTTRRERVAGRRHERAGLCVSTGELRTGRSRFAPPIPVTHTSDRTAPCTDRSTSTMIGTDTISRVIGQDVYDESGEKIGSAAEVYLDDETGQPEWVTVRTGLFGTKESFVPIRERRPDRRRRPRTRQQDPGEGRPEDRHRRPPVAAGGAGALPVLRHGRRHGHRHPRRPAPTTTGTDRPAHGRPTGYDRHRRPRHRRPRHLRPDHRRRHDAAPRSASTWAPAPRRSAAPGCASTSSPRTSPRPCP